MGKAAVRRQTSDVKRPGDPDAGRRRFLAGAVVAVAAAALPLKARAAAVLQTPKRGRIRTRPLTRAELYEDHKLAG